MAERGRATVAAGDLEKRWQVAMKSCPALMHVALVSWAMRREAKD